MQSYATEVFKPVTIGYYDDDGVYLLPTETWHALQQYCSQEGTFFPVSRATFFRMLKDRGLVTPSEKGHPTIQKKIFGKNERVLKFVRGEITKNFATTATDQ